MPSNVFSAAQSKVIENERFDAERAFYGMSNLTFCHCAFDGEADGESALKEASDIALVDTVLALRYPLWHTRHVTITDCEMPDTCRAALWYAYDVDVAGTIMSGIKAFRECDHTHLTACHIDSPEFGWRCRDMSVTDTTIASEYAFLNASGLDIDGLHLSGKYSFQYVENATIRNSTLDTKDAFWHSRNVTVYDSVIRGEYLGWYSENLRLIHCKIIGTQPLCYCHGLELDDCVMIDCDLSFERSDVHATVNGNIDSVKNIMSGTVVADGYGKVIDDGLGVDGASRGVYKRDGDVLTLMHGSPEKRR